VGPGGVIYQNGPLPLGSHPVKPGDFDFRPDSYIERTEPIFAAWFGFDQYRGYQLKKDVKSGMSMANQDTSQELHTYATKHYERYSYDPNTQTIMDVMAANQNGLEGINGNAAGSETQNKPFSSSFDQVNTKVPLMLGSDGTVLMSDGIVDPGGREIYPGSTGIGKAPVGIRIGRTDRQTFGSDDNELTRILYSAMKPIDLDGYNEDLNGNGLLDAGEDANGNGLLENGTMEADSRAYREYRDCFNMGLLDHIYISGTAYSPSGGGFSSVIEFNWKADSIKTKTADHVSQVGTIIHGTDTRTLANSYMNNYEYFASETDRRNRKYTVVRRGGLTMDLNVAPPAPPLDLCDHLISLAEAWTQGLEDWAKAIDHPDHFDDWADRQVEGLQHLASVSELAGGALSLLAAACTARCEAALIAWRQARSSPTADMTGAQAVCVLISTFYAAGSAVTQTLLLHLQRP
jgi:hypothetical protein